MAFAVTGITLVIAVSLGVAGLHATQSSLIEVAQEAQDANQALLRMLDAARRRLAILHDLQVSETTDPFVFEENIQTFYALGTEFAMARAELLDLGLPSTEQALLAGQREIAQELVALQERIIDLLRGGRRDLAGRLLVEEVQPRQARLLEGLEEVLALHAEHTRERTLQTTLLSRRVYWVLLAFGTIGIALVAGVAALTTRQVARGMATIEDQAARLDAMLQENEFQRQATDAHNIVSITDAAGDIIYANDKFCEVSQYSRAELIGNNHRLLRSGVHDDDFYRQMWETLTEGRIWQGEICNRRRDGSLYWVATTIVPFLDAAGLPYKYVSVRTDVTRIKDAEAVLLRGKEALEAMVAERTAALEATNAELAHEIRRREKLQAELEALATTDSLTGVANRREFNNVLRHEINRAERYLAPLSLILMDIDHFKGINDRFGHQAGDAVLRTFAQLIGEHVREQDVLARWGGEEFALLCPVTPLSGAEQLANNLRVLLRTHDFPHVGRLSCSFGLSEWRQGEPPGEFIERADVALYQAKEEGRDRVVTERGATRPVDE